MRYLDEGVGCTYSRQTARHLVRKGEGILHFLVHQAILIILQTDHVAEALLLSISCLGLFAGVEAFVMG